MRCTGCFTEFEEGEIAYATVVGSIEKFDGDYDDQGFYPDETESWITVLCEECSVAVHDDFIAGYLQAKYFSKTKKQTHRKRRS
ncbi:MAG: hypothetical protein AB1480_05375 [Nitrospirota bacterium]